MKTKLILTILICAPLLVSAQDFGGISQNNLSGIYSTLLNPANAAGGIDKFSFNVLGVSASAYNNSIRTDLDYDLLRIVGRRPLRLEPGSLDRIAVTAPRKKVRKPIVYAEADALQLAAQVAITKKISVYAFARERAIANFDKGDYKALQYLVDVKYDHSDPVVRLGFDARSLSYQELGVGGALQIYEKKEHFLKVGFTYKRINARGIYAVNVPKFESKLVDTSIVINAQLSIIETALDVATENPLDFILNPSMGGGNALDIGFIYEHRPRSLKSTYRKNNLKKRNSVFNSRNLTKYDYRIGVSLNDFGRVNFNEGVTSSSTNSVSTVFGQSELAQMTSEEYANSLRDRSQVISGSEALSFRLPARLIVSYDQRLIDGWFTSVTLHQNMMKKGIGSFYQPTQYQVQLRKETEKCVFGFPFLAMPATRTFILGAYAQTGPFFIGTENLGTLFLKKMYNPSIYTGVFYNIRYKADKTIENHKSFRTRRKRIHQWSVM